jgi:hypothetical protein
MVFLVWFFLQNIEQDLKYSLEISTPVYHRQLMTTDQIESPQNSTNKNSHRLNSFLIAEKDWEQIGKSLQNSTNRNHFNSDLVFHIHINQSGEWFEDLILFPRKTLFRIISIDHQSYCFNFKFIFEWKSKKFDWIRSSIGKSWSIGWS